MKISSMIMRVKITIKTPYLFNVQLTCNKERIQNDFMHISNFKTHMSFISKQLTKHCNYKDSPV